MGSVLKESSNLKTVKLMNMNWVKDLVNEGPDFEFLNDDFLQTFFRPWKCMKYHFVTFVWIVNLIY
jgi:hypothetical protein